MNSKEKYRQLCKDEKTIPIFSKDWWMDAVCGENNWEVLIVEKGGEIVASMPVYIKQKMGLRYITQPKLTQTNGIHIRYPKNQKYSKKLSYEKEVMNGIVQQLEGLGVLYYQQNFHYSFTNWLPFYWKGFQQTTRYTYVIEGIDDLDRVYEQFEYSKRKNINKAKKLFRIKIGLSPNRFYKHHQMTLSQQNKKINYSFEVFKKIYDLAYKNNSCFVIYAIDKDDIIHSSVFIIWDNCSAYDLISTIDFRYRSLGSSDLLIHESIKYLVRKTKKFDFEGSMIEGVENSFRRFGAIQKPYFTISKAFKYKLLFNLYKSVRRF